ncbi:MAG: GntR family transcriptional regulator [Rhodoplanes sp.]|uniref:GntR family transcriptional regulator n=1 Tax=Rhodoplanes sp. TaxID=1968906 RepID=UPI0017B701DB|nr:GntR family transcriptional regulator [Rhodoplanes sp.]NVO15785.1 GntR family transcriptional regulator [Rhodoplanes sp.]
MYDCLPSIDVSTLQERVYQSLRLAFLRGHFQPGDQISIRKLADALGTSPMPVREALKRLMAEKAVEQSSNRQIRVAPFNSQVHQEFVRIRMQLEGYAAERAVRLRDAGLVAKLADINQQMLAAAKAGQIDAALTGNHSFHFEIYRTTGYSQLVDILESLWMRTGPFLATIHQKPAHAVRFFENGHRFHARVIEAIKAQDVKAARRAIALDIRTGTMFLSKIYEPKEPA